MLSEKFFVRVRVVPSRIASSLKQKDKKQTGKLEFHPSVSYISEPRLNPNRKRSEAAKVNPHVVTASQNIFFLPALTLFIINNENFLQVIHRLTIFIHDF